MKYTIEHIKPYVILSDRTPPNLTGQVFGRFTVTGYLGLGRELSDKPNNRSRYYLCECSCNGEYSVIRDSHLISGTSTSCGCNRITNPYRKHDLYHTWWNMNDRCNNPDNHAYNDYGGRGITVHSDWHKDNPSGMANFAQAMGKRPEGATLDRIDPNGNYELLNTQWANWVHQHSNKRTSFDWVMVKKLQLVRQLEIAS